MPIKIRSLEPADFGSADAAYVATGDDGQDYVVKTEEDSPGIPAAEWFCHKLAEFVALAVPQYSVLDLDGVEVFGSRFNSAAVTDEQKKIDILVGTEKANLLSERLSAILAFDLFVGNEDRHMNNYLFLKMTKNYSVVAFDFGRSWTWCGWPVPIAPTDCNTRKLARIFDHHHQFSAQAAQKVIASLRAVNASSIATIYDAMPVHWMEESKKGIITKWWSTEARAERLNMVEQELQNGFKI